LIHVHTHVDIKRQWHANTSGTSDGERERQRERREGRVEGGKERENRVRENCAQEKLEMSGGGAKNMGTELLNKR
jgi:hypothetical protein